MSLFVSKKIGIDLGTANVVLWESGKGILMSEPSVVAVTDDFEVLAVGKEAQTMVGRTPDNIKAIYPLKDGVIADYIVTEAMLRYFISKAQGTFQIFKPIVMVCVPGGGTNTERKAALDATIEAGAKEAYLIEEPLAAAIGAGIPISSPTGSMIIDIGGGTTEAAILSLGGIVNKNSIRVGGNKLDQAIVTFIRKQYNLMIGDRTAEQVKIDIGSALNLPEELSMDIRGRDLISGLPKTITVTSSEITYAIAPILKEVLGVVKSVLEKTPPELSSDVIDRGIILTGGGALLRNLDQFLTNEIEVGCQIADDPLLCVVKGVGMALDNLEIFKRTLNLLR